MISDQFALLGKPRRPWLDPEELKDSFHRLTVATHPDRTGVAGESAEINAGYAILRDAGTRLRHLLELEHPEVLDRPAQVPAEMANIFLRLATLRRAVDAFVEQQTQASTPLAQALLASERFALQQDVEKELAALEHAQERCLEEVRSLDGNWEEHRPEIVDRLALLQQELSYFGKWNWQLREALFRLQSGSPAA